MKNFNLFFLLLLLFLLFFVDCSVEEISKLRSEWRDKLIENNEIMNEIKKSKDDFVIENSFFSKLSAIKDHLISLHNLNKTFLIEEKDPNLWTIISSKAKALKKLEEIKKKAEFEFENKKMILLTKEQEFEEFWDDEYFIKSFDFILKQSLMAPVPHFPQIYAEIGRESLIRKALEKRSAALIDLEGKIIKRRREKLKEINGKIVEIEKEFKTFNFMQIIGDNFEMLKRNVLAMKFKEEAKKPKLLDFIDLYQKNQKEEMNLMGKKYLNESTIKLKGYLDFLLSGDQWKLRLGPIKPIESAAVAATVIKSPFPVLIENKITSVSRIASDMRARQCQYIKLIKYNDTEKMKYVSLIDDHKIYKFMVKKCAKMVEDMHKYLVKEDDKEVKGIYHEVIDDLVAE